MVLILIDQPYFVWLLPTSRGTLHTEQSGGDHPKAMDRWTWSHGPRRWETNNTSQERLDGKTMENPQENGAWMVVYMGVSWDSLLDLPSGKRLQKTVSENYGNSPFSLGKLTMSTGPCSIAMLNYQRVLYVRRISETCWVESQERRWILIYSQWTWPKWVVPYLLWRLSHTFEHPKFTPYGLSLLLNLSPYSFS